MCSNLINDLLDLAKLENNSFQIHKEYFNLAETIYESFQILLFSATQVKVHLSAEIDNERNLGLIKAIYGD